MIISQSYDYLLKEFGQDRINQNEDLINDAAEMCLYKIEKGIYKKKVPTNSFEDYDKILDEDTEKYIEFINSKEISDDNFTKL